MKHFDKLWSREVSREDVSSFLMEGRPIVGRSKSVSAARPQSLPDLSMLTIEDGDIHSPSASVAVVVDDKKSTDFFSWAYAFAEGCVPLSTHQRVVLKSDVPILIALARRSENSRKNNIWSCLILGEILYRSGTSETLSRLVGTWLESAFTRAFFLASTVDPSSDQIANVLFERLARLRDSRLLKSQSVDLEFLKIVWEVASSIETSEFGRASDNDLNPGHVIEIVVNAYMDRVGASRSQREALERLRSEMESSSDSVEERIMSFDRVVETCRPFSSDLEELGGVILGLYAFVVGRGSSHIGLLDRIEPRFKGAYLWFALCVSLIGRSEWETRWLNSAGRAANHLNRASQNIAFGDVDLCWAEYQWIEKFLKPDYLSKKLSRASTTSVSIEVLPFVPILLGIDNVTKNLPKQQSGKAPGGEMGEAITLIEKALAQIKGYGGSVSVESRIQEELPLDAPSPKRKATKRRR